VGLARGIRRFVSADERLRLDERHLRQRLLNALVRGRCGELRLAGDELARDRADVTLPVMVAMLYWLPVPSFTVTENFDCLWFLPDRVEVPSAYSTLTVSAQVSGFGLDGPVTVPAPPVSFVGEHPETVPWIVIVELTLGLLASGTGA